MDAHTAVGKATGLLDKAATTDSPVLRQSLTAQAQGYATLALVGETRELCQAVKEAAQDSDEPRLPRIVTDHVDIVSVKVTNRAELERLLWLVHEAQEAQADVEGVVDHEGMIAGLATGLREFGAGVPAGSDS